MTKKTAVVAALAVVVLAWNSSLQAGTFSVLPLTGDGDSGISAGSAYTHALDLNYTGNRTINDAVFTGSGAGNATPSTNNYSVGGSDGLFGPSGIGSTVSGGIGSTMTQFVYNGQPQTFTLNNLRVGEDYVTTFYNTAFGSTGRFVSIATSDGGALASYEQNQNHPAGTMVKYAFTATANTMTYTLTPDDPGASFHFYSATNELANYTALLTDNFYVAGNPNTGDVNFNLNDRQGGTLNAGVGITSYSTDGGNVQMGNVSGGIDNGHYLLAAGNGKFSPNYNFSGASSEGGLLVSFDMAPNVGSSGDTSVWGSINLGMDVSQQFTSVNGPNEHFGLLLRGNGGIQAFDGSALVSGAETWTSETNVTTQLHHFELLITDSTDGNPFDGVGQTTIDLYADGQFVYSYTKTGGGYDQNFMNLYGLDIAGFDNLMIAQRNAVVPEPSSLALALLGLVAVGGSALRRRRMG